MRKALLIFLFVLSGIFSFSQTAANFNCNDCSSNNHDLFTELNAGKVIVIAWVMPCANCISGALAGYTECQNYPGQAFFYLADDVANTSCTTLSSWANTNGMNSCDAIFSNSAVNMSAYGAAGMPKVIVVGGSNHTVYYNQNGSSVSQSGIQSAITAAIAANASGIKANENNTFESLQIFPNPTNAASTLSLKLSKGSKVKIDIQNILGEKIADIFNGNLIQGDNNVNVNTSNLSNGNYFITCNDGETSKKIKLIVLH